MSHTEIDDRRPARVDEPRLARILEAGARAPSGENSQPWAFRWDGAVHDGAASGPKPRAACGGAVLTIVHDEVRAKHVINYKNHSSYMALGALLEGLAIAATAEGLSTEVDLSLDDPESRWARVRFFAYEGSPHELAPALPRRWTERRPHNKGSIAHPVFSAIKRDGDRYPGARLFLTDRIEGELLDFSIDADAVLWRDRDTYLDVFRWLRFTHREVEETSDGIPWTSTGFHLPEIPLLRIARARQMWEMLERFRLFSVSRPWVKWQLTSSAALLLITVGSKKKEDLVAAGRLGFVAWLRLNQAGYAVQPMTIQSTPLYDDLVVGPRPSMRPEHVALYRRGHGIVRRAFGHGPDDLPVWMLRTGLAPSTPQPIRTRRLPLDRSLTITRAR
jgi:hypothetical protein